MSVHQSGSTMESVFIHPEVFREWKLCNPFVDLIPVQLHAKFWGKSMADEEQKWCNTQPPMEGSERGNEHQAGYEPMDVDVKDYVGEEEDDIIEGCCFLNLGLDIEGFVTPMIWNHVGSLAIVSPITSSIKSRLVNHFRTLEHHEQIHFYKSFAKVPDSRTVADVFFEARAQRCLQDGVELEIIPMVLPVSSTSGLPQWHSSHIAFLNNVELERSRQQALQRREPLMIWTL